MIETFSILVVALLAGLGTGIWYFGGLWLTVHHLRTARRPVLFLLVSFLVRTLVSAWGVYVTMQGSGSQLAAAFLGLMVIRAVCVRIAL
jgi:F1F0 ATPase subunit 2